MSPLGAPRSPVPGLGLIGDVGSESQVLSNRGASRFYSAPYCTDMLERILYFDRLIFSHWSRVSEHVTIRGINANRVKTMTLTMLTMLLLLMPPDSQRPDRGPRNSSWKRTKRCLSLAVALIRY
ncbi:hypothetical protein TNCV_1214741 [Trichonephila clavipes]|nr:hypothetical protein TNCV_1214741 [Trichonephila clavipes]